MEDGETRAHMPAGRAVAVKTQRRVLRNLVARLVRDGAVDIDASGAHGFPGRPA